MLNIIKCPLTLFEVEEAYLRENSHIKVDTISLANPLKWFSNRMFNPNTSTEMVHLYQNFRQKGKKITIWAQAENTILRANSEILIILNINRGWNRKLIVVVIMHQTKTYLKLLGFWRLIECQCWMVAIIL
jgi:hypothetical protein